MHRHDGDFSWPEVARHGHEAWWYGPLHLAFVLLLIALLVVGVVWLVRRLQLGAAAVPAPAPAAGTIAAIPVAGPATDPAVAALRMRYARGEVSRDDYLSGMEDLTGSADRRDDGQAGEDTEPIGT